MTTNQVVQVPVQLFQAVLQYLGTRPYREVHVLAGALQGMPGPVELAATEKQEVSDAQ